MDEKIQGRQSSLQQEYLARETFDDDDELRNRAFQYLKDRVTRSRAVLRRFKILTVVLFIICLGLVAALSQLLTSTSYAKSAELFQGHVDSLKGNCTSESLSNFISRYNCDPEVQQEEELQQKMDSIVRHIMQGSNDAIVPRFNLRKREGEADIPTNHYEGTSALYVDLSKKDVNGLNDQVNSTLITTTSSSVFPTTSGTSFDGTTSSTSIFIPSSTSTEGTTTPEASSSFNVSPTPLTTSSSTEPLSTESEQTTTTSSSSSSSSSPSSSPEDASSEAQTSTDDSPSSSSSASQTSSTQAAQTSSTEDASSSSPSSSDDSSETSDVDNTFSSIPQTSTDDDSASEASTSADPTSTEEASSTTDATITSAKSSTTPFAFSSTSGSVIVMGFTTVVNNTTITSLHTVIASPTGAENTGSASKNSGSSGLSTEDQHIVIGCVVGLGVPIIAIIAGAFYWYRRKQTDTTGKNYVDSNGRDVGIAVGGDNILEKLKFWKNNRDTGDFNDDSLDEDFSLDDPSESHIDDGTPQSGESTERSFVVDRSKRTRNQTDHNF